MTAGPLVIVGDSFLDVDIAGVATRLCPDAPVPVVDLTQRHHRPGGAGLAALLAAAAGADVVLITALGRDADAEVLVDLLADRVRVVRLPMAGSTVTKTRIAAADVPMLRLDTGTGGATPEPVSAAVRQAVREAGTVLVSDYGRGVTDVPELRAEVEAVASRVAVIWDPHPRGSAPVPGCRLVTPNLAEAHHFGGPGGDPAAVGGLLAARWRAAAVAVTLGADGAVLSRRSADGEYSPSTSISAPAREEVATAPSSRVRASRIDSCGAGDQFAVAAALALRSGADLPTATRTAVSAATRFVRAGAAGSVSVIPDTESRRRGGSGAAAQPDAWVVADHVRRTGGRLIATGGCFDLLHPGHVELLEAARELGDALIVCLNSDASVRRSKGPTRPLVGQADRARVLQALAAVDAVTVFDEDTPVELLAALRPDVWVKGSDYEHQPMPEADIVRAYGGQVRLIPLVDGYSTTALVYSTRQLPFAPLPDPVSLEV